MSRISVIVPFHNARRYVRACVEGLLSQSYPREGYEVIMVDNNSTDGSASIVAEYPGIRLMSEAKQGAYAARNRGVRAASGDILAFTDPDCIPSSNWLREIAVIMDGSNVGIVIGRHQFGGASRRLALLEAYEHEKNTYVFSSNLKELYFGHTNNMAVRRALFDEVGPFVERARGADTIFVQRCVERYSCPVVRYCERVEVRHLEVDSVTTLYRKFFVYGRSRRAYRHLANMRPLTNRERLLVFRRVLRSGRQPWPRALLLALLLAVGLGHWVLGGLSERWGWRRRAR